MIFNFNTTSGFAWTGTANNNYFRFAPPKDPPQRTALIKKLAEAYGPRNAADLLVLAQRLVNQGLFPHLPAACKEIIAQNPDVPRSSS